MKLVKARKVAHAVLVRLEDGQHWPETVCKVPVNPAWPALADVPDRPDAVCPSCMHRVTWFLEMLEWGMGLEFDDSEARSYRPLET